MTNTVEVIGSALSSITREMGGGADPHFPFDQYQGAAGLLDRVV